MKSLFLGLLGLCFASATAQAVVIGWTATLDPGQETHVVTAPPGAGGTATGSIDTVSGLLSWNISFSNLSGAPTGIHFHGAAPPGSGAGVRLNIGGISGLGSPTIGSANVSAAFVDEILQGLWYINVHTAQNGAGEIRGQVEPVPVPAAAVLMLGGIGATVLVSRRKKA